MYVIASYEWPIWPNQLKHKATHANQLNSGKLCSLHIVWPYMAGLPNSLIVFHWGIGMYLLRFTNREFSLFLTYMSYVCFVIIELQTSSWKMSEIIVGIEGWLMVYYLFCIHHPPAQKGCIVKQVFSHPSFQVTQMVRLLWGYCMWLPQGVC